MDCNHILASVIAVEFERNTGFLTFTRPWIVIYSYNKSQQDSLFLNFILVNSSTYFGQTYYRDLARRQST